MAALVINSLSMQIHSGEEWLVGHRVSREIHVHFGRWSSQKKPRPHQVPIVLTVGGVANEKSSVSVNDNNNC